MCLLCEWVCMCVCGCVCVLCVLFTALKVLTETRVWKIIREKRTRTLVIELSSLKKNWRFPSLVFEQSDNSTIYFLFGFLTAVVRGNILHLLLFASPSLLLVCLLLRFFRWESQSVNWAKSWKRKRLRVYVCVRLPGRVLRDSHSTTAQVVLVPPLYNQTHIHTPHTRPRRGSSARPFWES